VTEQQQRRAALREQQAERWDRVGQRIRLQRIADLCDLEQTPVRVATIDGLASMEAIKASPNGLQASALPAAVLDRLIQGGRVATFRGVVVERGGG
jgi:hypothetical protein